MSEIDVLAPIRESAVRFGTAKSRLPLDDLIANPLKAIEYVAEMEELEAAWAQYRGRFDQLDVRGDREGEQLKRDAIADLDNERDRWLPARSAVSTRNHPGGPRLDFRPYEFRYVIPLWAGREQTTIERVMDKLCTSVFYGPNGPPPHPPTFESLRADIDTMRSDFRETQNAIQTKSKSKEKPRKSPIRKSSAEKPNTPTDLLRLNVICNRYKVDRSTIQRLIDDRQITSFRPKNAGKTSPHMVSEADIAARYPRRL